MPPKFRYRDRRISGHGKGRVSYTVDMYDANGVPRFHTVIEGKVNDWHLEDDLAHPAGRPYAPTFHSREAAADEARIRVLKAEAAALDAERKALPSAPVRLDRRLPFTVARKVWVILQEECGAPTDYDSAMAFVALQDEGTPPYEYRFQGALGFGGKLWNEAHNGLSVDCYDEGLTAERRVMIAKANLRLHKFLLGMDV